MIIHGFLCIYGRPCTCAGAPKILFDSLQREITASVGEPYRIRIPFKGSPAPTASWFNVRTHRLCLSFAAPYSQISGFCLVLTWDRGPDCLFLSLTFSLFIDALTDPKFATSLSAK